MRRLSLSLVMLSFVFGALSIGATHTAYAQDILNSLYSSRPVAMWHGVYVGGNVGYGWGKTNTDASGVAATPTISYTMNGFVGGAQMGGNYQTGNLVLGFEVDFQGTSQKSSSSTIIAGALATDTSKLPWFSTARLRLGVAADALLIYATAGAAYGEHRRQIQYAASGTIGLDSTVTRIGWAAGGGIEGLLSKNWAWRAEYLHLQFGTYNQNFIVTVGGVSVGTMTMNTKVTDNIARFSLNYFLR